jgi:hypothetical protein
MNEGKKPFGNSFFEKKPNAEIANAESVNSSFSEKSTAASNQLSVPPISLPKGGVALKGIDEKFSVIAANGSSTLSIPLPISPGRNDFRPALVLSYDLRVRNSLFGLLWDVDSSAFQRKIDKNLPNSLEHGETNDYLLSQIENLVSFVHPIHSWKEIKNPLWQQFNN